jgi:hypothetical protein
MEKKMCINFDKQWVGPFISKLVWTPCHQASLANEHTLGISGKVMKK